MADITDRQEGQDEAENLQDAFISSFLVGAVTIAIWLGVFLIYLDRL